MNKYVAIYRQKRIEVEAENSYQAQLEAARLLRIKKAYMVSVFLTEKDGKEYVHSTAEV